MISAIFVEAAPSRVSPVAIRAASRFDGIDQRAESDRRWPAMLREIEDLHERGRRSIRIVDADCGAGELLIHAARRARELGFVAIEGRGIDTDPRLVARAQKAAARLADPAIGLIFECADREKAMREEAEFPADLLLCPASGANVRSLIELTLAAGKFVLCDRIKLAGGKGR